MSFETELPPAPQKLCAFCLNTCCPSNGKKLVNSSTVVDGDGDTNELNEEYSTATQSFIKFFERFVGQRINNKYKAQSLWKRLESCDDCKNIIKSLCSIHHEMRCLELQLEWKLETLINIMKIANRAPSKLRQLKSVLKQTECENGAHLSAEDCNRDKDNEAPSTLSCFQGFRNDVIKKGVRKLSTSPPRIIVKKIKGSTMTTIKLDIDQSQLPLTENKYSTENDDVEEHVFYVDTTRLGEDSEEKEDNVCPNLENSQCRGRHKLQMKKTVEIQSPTVTDVVTKMELVVDDHSNVQDFSAELDRNDDLEDFRHPINSEDDTNVEANDFWHEETKMTLVKTEGCPTDFHYHHSESSKIFCKLCSKKFEKNWLLKRHMTTQHLKGKVKQSPSNVLPPNSQSKNLPLNSESVEQRAFEKDAHTETPESENEELPKSATKSRKRITLEHDDQQKQANSDISFVNGSENEFIAIKSVKQEQQKSERMKQDNQKVTSKTDKPVLWCCRKEGCSRQFINETRYKQHQKRHRTIHKRIQKPLKHYNCPIDNCTKTFSTREKLEVHQKLHGCYKCAFCDVVKNHATSLSLHETEHAIRAQTSSTKSGEKSFNCARCPKDFFLEHKYTRHYINSHLNLSSKLPTQTCPICSSENKGGTEDYFRDHYRTYHKIEGMDPLDIQRCLQCPAFFVKSDQLLQHIVIIHFKRKCPECGKLFVRKPSLLREHIENKHPFSNAFPHLLFPCDMGSCKRKFASEAELNKHKEQDRHYDEKKMKCTKCDREFHGEIKLRTHMHDKHPVHTHICPECGKGFNNKYKVKIHMEYHKDPALWKFECETCGKKCVDKSKLQQHLRTHTQEKLFVCQLCGEKYAHRHNWLHHMKTKHPGEFNEAGLTSSRTGIFLSRKGSKKGQCVTSGANVTENKI